MTNQEKAIRFNEIMEDQQFVQQMENVINTEEAQSVFSQFGLELSSTEVNEIMASLAQQALNTEDSDGEIADAELEMVSGGVGWRAIKTTWKVMSHISSKYWGSSANAHKQTVGFWGNVITQGWNTAVANNGRH